MDRLAADYHAILDLIEDGVLLSAPVAALQLAAAVIETDGYAFEHADDSNGDIGAVFHRAVALFGRAAAGCPSEAVVATMQPLRADNPYGARDGLLRETAAALSPAARDGLIAEFRRDLTRGSKPVTCSAAMALQEIAEALGDPVLYEDAAKHLAAGPVRQLEVVRRYLEAGRAQEALDRLPPSPTGFGLYASDWVQTRIAILRALGRTAELRVALWGQFQAAPGQVVLEEWLATAPESEREAMLAQAREEVLRPVHPPIDQARYFLGRLDPETAAHCILSRLPQCDGAAYDELAPVAKQLGPSQPLAASALYRKLVDATLGTSRSRYYHHAVRYWRALEQLAPRVARWEPLVPPAAYADAMRAAHGRKTAFWTQLLLPSD